MRTIVELNVEDITEIIAEKFNVSKDNVTVRVDENWHGPLGDQRTLSVSARVNSEVSKWISTT